MKENLQLNIPGMDEMHDEFFNMLEGVQTCEGSEFLPLFEEMINHTKEHFAYEEYIMEQYRFYGKEEHVGEHTKILNEMQYFFQKAKKIPVFGKFYIMDYAYEKLERHIINIDAQLAMFLKDQQISL